MGKRELINNFAKQIVDFNPRKDSPTPQQITNTLVTAALNLAFVNESCKSTGQVSKSQVIYRKLKNTTIENIQECFQKLVTKFLLLLKIFSRNRKFLLSFDTTKEAFYGDFSKAEDKLYLHEGSIVRESEYYYEHLTVVITCNNAARYIIDGVIIPIGAYIENYVKEMIIFIKKTIQPELFLFDRGFTSWALINTLKKLNVPYMIFWRKEGNWYKKYFNKLKDGELIKLSREGKYNENMTNYLIVSNFVLIKQYEYDGKKYDWIFATNINLKTAENYIKRYKKRWGIETIYRVTDDIRAYTTSTKAIIRYFLFMFTCLVYNVWKYFQTRIDEDFTLANFKTNMTIFMTKTGKMYPTHYNQFEKIMLNNTPTK